MNLKTELPRLLPKAVEWAKEQEEHAKQLGKMLPDHLAEAARRVGVQKPESIRLMVVDRLPRPEDPELQVAADETGLLGPNMEGLTLGYAIFIVAGHETVRLISHECRHVHQYEANGGISGFLPIYLGQVVSYGYYNAPMEVDARSHEIHFI